jgi:serine-type D-Ala-D-Ala endopeptidase (penicillin-binding protein 7)
MKKLILIAISVLMFNSAHGKTGPSHLVLDISKKETISASNQDTVRPIASLTKLMTALVIVESEVYMDQEVDYHGGIWKNKKVKRSQLLESLLIKSDNLAAEALAESFPGGRQVFINAMNARAKSLGMLQTSFEDPSGLGRSNLSTAADLTILVTVAYNHPEISATSSSKFFKVEIKNKRKITYMNVGNTNSQLLNVFDNISLSKTGYTDPAGRCLALIVEKNDKKYAIIILGEKTSGDRFYRARNLINMVSQ